MTKTTTTPPESTTETIADINSIAKWYKGVARTAITRYVIPTLEHATVTGYWEKGDSRKVRAALNKTHRGLTAQAATEGAVVLGRGRAGIDVEYGCIGTATAHLKALRVLGSYDAPSFRQWCLDFAPVAELLQRLDAGRPKPVYVFASISRAVVDNVAKQMGIEFASVRAPEIIWHKEFEKIDGQEVMRWRPQIVWPEGTRHHTSRFATGSAAGNAQCHACGHVIRNAYNWVPLVADSSDGLRSLWVGHDCARNLFGTRIAGCARFDARGPT